ncbi:MAG: SPOR domain-containing protein [Allosphingosinicella sp.]
MIAPEREAETPAARRYRPTRAWPVGGLALVAAAGAVLATGTISSAMDGGPGAPSLQPVAIALAAAPPAPAQEIPSLEPPPAGGWQVQVGAFRSLPAAEAHLRALESELPELTRLTAAYQLRGGLNRIRIGGIGDESAAGGLCERIAETGRGCFVVGPAG